MFYFRCKVASTVFFILYSVCFFSICLSLLFRMYLFSMESFRSYFSVLVRKQYVSLMENVARAYIDRHALRELEQQIVIFDDTVTFDTDCFFRSKVTLLPVGSSIEIKVDFFENNDGEVALTW